MSWKSGFQLRVAQGNDLDMRTSLDFPRMTLGRARAEGSRADGWVLLFDKAVSRQHAELSWDESAGTFRLRHLSKTNFTWIDDEPLEGESLLREGQIVKLGGSLLIYEAAEEVDDSVVPENQSPLAASGELTERLPTAQAAAAVSLRQGDNPLMSVLEGPDQGRQMALTGFYLTVGRENLTAEALLGGEKKDVVKFDQSVELTDPSVLPNHLILRWDELRQAFSVWKNPSSHPIQVMRDADGFAWQAILSDSGGLVRKNDRIRLGNTVLMLGVEPSAEKSSIKPLTL